MGSLEPRVPVWLPSKPSPPLLGTKSTRASTLFLVITVRNHTDYDKEMGSISK